MTKILPKIFLDSCVVKSAADTRLEFVPEEKKLDWGGTEQRVVVYKTFLANDNVKQFYNDNNKERFLDSVCTRFLAALGKKGLIELCWHTETIWEHAGLPKTQNKYGVFHGAKLKHVDDPFPYSRIIASGNGMKKIDYQFDFYKSIKDDRYDELKNLTNVHAQVKENRIKNQMADAFHILCAERSECGYFVTIDYSLVKNVGSSTMKPKTKITTPSKLMSFLLIKKPWWVWNVLLELIRIKLAKRKIYMYRQKFNIFTGEPE